MSPAVPQVGTVLGQKYRIVRALGEGGMGAVYEAEHLVTQKRIAVKWMHPHVAGVPDAAERFVREAQACARVRHPNIVDIYDVLQEGDSVFLVMELLEGITLSTYLERGGFRVPELIALLLPAMKAVAAAHKQGVVHRDIKPDNIFLARQEDTEGFVPKVLDFGISKVLGGDDMHLTRTGVAMGTPLYMSLEQITGAKDVDIRTDVYAFGVILYQGFTGRMPFEADTLPELAVKLATTESSEATSVRPDIPSDLSRLLQWAMARDREQRVPSLDAFVQELEPFAWDSFYARQGSPGPGEAPSVEAAPSRAPAYESSARSKPPPQAQAQSSAAEDWTLPAHKGPRRVLMASALIALVCAGGAAFFYAGSDSPQVTAAPPAQHAPPKLPALAPEPPKPEPQIAASDGPHDGPANIDDDTPSSKRAETEKRAARRARKPGRAPKARDQSKSIPSSPSPEPPQQTSPAAKQAEAPPPELPTEPESEKTAQTTRASASLVAERAPAEASTPRAVEPPPKPAAAPMDPPAATRPVAKPTTWRPIQSPYASDGSDAAKRRTAMLRDGPPYRSVAQAKAAYRAKQLDKATYKDNIWTLKYWLKQQIIAEKGALRAGDIDKNTYRQRVQELERSYRGS